LTDPLKLTFPSSHICNLQLRNEKGDVVAEYWTETIPATGLPAGQYSLEGSLVNSAGGRFTATASFRLP
jgi:hypothetical protein